MLFYHIPLSDWSHRLPPIFFRCVGIGYTAVPFFFVLSGFVLAISYLKPEKPIRVARFYSARFARIYPALFACLCLDVPHFLYTSLQISHESVKRILLEGIISFAALGAWFGMPILDSPSWSISVEFFFYLCFPLIGAFLWRLPGKVLWISAVALYILDNAVIQAISRPQDVDYTHCLDYHPIAHLAEFLFGIALARLFEYVRANHRLAARLERYSPLIAVAAVFARYCIPIFDLPVSPSLLQHAFLVPIDSAIILAFSSGNTLIARFFARRPFVILGEASFALYLVHVPVFLIANHWINLHPGPLIPIYVVACVALSVLSFHFLETPARLWIMRKLHQQAQENVVVLSAGQ